VITVLLVYQPVWRAGFNWDDEGHVTRPSLRSWYGVYRIWFQLGATQQYYPLLHTAFWVQHKLWGGNPSGYHIVNILLHALVAVMVALVLRRLAVPGAYLAAAIFALHPVHVETAAWISELKNTLSGTFYLGAMLVYLRFDEARKRRSYWGALGLFVLALASKTVTATLPAALLVIFWWQRGRLSWRRDVMPLIPFFVLGVAAGVLTACVERTLIGAEGPAFEMTFVERCLLAGRVVWFYLSKLFWPADLVFFYPRWRVSQADWWQYLYPATALLLLAGLWALRRRWRAPLAGLLFFIGTLFPVLGFLNVYPFVFAFVADHYQYLASLGIITLTAAGAALLLGRWGLWHRPAGNLLCLALLAILGTASWRQSWMYTDLETLYRVTMDRDPECWVAPYNLGTFLSHAGRLTEAIAQFRRAVEIKPDYALAYNNLGSALTELGRFDEAVNNFQRAVKIQPDFVEVYGNLGTVLGQMEKFDEAIACFHRALAIRPDYVAAHSHLGNTLVLAGRLPEAMAQFEAALDIDPSDAETHCYLGNVLARQGQLDEAIEHYRTALERQPDSAEFHCRLGSALACRGRFDEALASCQKALELQPNNAFVHNSLAFVLVGQRQYDGAIRHYRRALELQSGNVEFQKNLAWLLATSPETSLRNGTEAMELALHANQFCGGKRADILDTLAAAYAEVGWFSEAVVAERKALELALRQSDHVSAKAMRARLALYESGRPYRQTR